MSLNYSKLSHFPKITQNKCNSNLGLPICLRQGLLNFLSNNLKMEIILWVENYYNWLYLFFASPTMLEKVVLCLAKNTGLFCYRLLVRYTKKIPQLSTSTLVYLSTKLAGMGSKCCILSESRRTACATDYVSLLKYNKPIMMNFGLEIYMYRTWLPTLSWLSGWGLRQDPEVDKLFWENSMNF